MTAPVAMLVLTDESQQLGEIEHFSGEELVVLVVLDRNTLATNFDGKMERLERKAGELREKMLSKGKKCRVLIEWGEKTEAVSNALQREQAQLLNRLE
ncbi:hypothetical protein HY995_02765 [Candidatus Micrarchaeota archaeon]|nr:hypothetical protein [Candidatus Micrarchaeota archaeon]MBI5176984.1 hypothetical protein [Candidatus Micrarchaeota archaeon]